MTTADTKCANCYRDFADHDYVKNSIDKYKCPFPTQESTYGYYTGGDPRQFHPDGQDCTEQELRNHRKACELWNEAEAKGETPTPEKCPSGWIYDDNGKTLAHVLRAPYGIGVQTYETETYFEPLEHNYEIDCRDYPH